MAGETERPLRWVVDLEHPGGHAVPMTDEEVRQLVAEELVAIAGKGPSSARAAVFDTDRFGSALFN